MQKINELQLAKELIRFPTVTPVDAGVMKFLEKKLKKLGFKTKILEFKERGFKPVRIYMQDWDQKNLIFVMQVTSMLCLQEI